jgi:hemerythrin-like metal-binding protein
MALVEWRAEYNIGNASIDRQHRSLVDLLNELHAAMLAGGNSDKMHTVFNGLVRYTESHFSAEEAMLERAGYSGLGQHRKEHAAFVSRLVELGGDLKAGRFTAPIQLLTTVKNWLFQHILSSDKAYMRAIGAGHEAQDISREFSGLRR